MGRFLEVCCVSAADVAEAQAGGAGRVELCENLAVGGVTPSRELIAEVMKISSIPVNVLIRPRKGDFVYSAEEEARMVQEIIMCRELGVNGVVIGALRSDGSVDTGMIKRLMEIARPLSVTFHRAFDRCCGPFEALEEIIALGCDRILTSGQKESSYDGRFLLAELVRRAGGRIVVMPGGGIRPSNIGEIAALTEATEYHSSSRDESGRTSREVIGMLVG